MRWGIAFALLAACGDSSDEGRSWNGITNPMLGFDDVAIKDAWMMRGPDGVWRLGYSEIHDNPLRFDLGFASSTDLVTFERGESLDQPETGGIASPDVVRMPDGSYVMTYNSHTTDVNGTQPKLYYRTSTDLVTWSEAHRFHIEGADADDDRLIDASLSVTNGPIYLTFKRDQSANVAVSTLGDLDGPWELLGEVVPSQIENYQAVELPDGHGMLATTIPLIHDPTLYTTYDHMSYSKLSTITVEEQAWNTGESRIDHETANAAYLVDDRDPGNDWFLIYAGSTEITTFGGRGHSSLGIARSRDLLTWEVAPAR